MAAPTLGEVRDTLRAIFMYYTRGGGTSPSLSASAFRKIMADSGVISTKPMDKGGGGEVGSALFQSLYNFSRLRCPPCSPPSLSQGRWTSCSRP